MKIGFFDSGLGGMLVLKAVAKALPEYDYEYYGDTTNLPFGDKTEKEIYKYTEAGMDHLFKKDCALVIIACNTSSAESLRMLQDGYLFKNYPDRRILGVIIPAVEELIDTKSHKALLLATKRTIDSRKYEKELDKRSMVHTKLYGEATPELVPLIESGQIDEAVHVAQSRIEKTLHGEGELDTVVLGCTHYAKLKEQLRKTYGPTNATKAGKEAINFISQDELIPVKLKSYLQKHQEIETKLSKNGTRNIFVTEHRAEYDELIQDLLGGRLLAE